MSTEIVCVFCGGKAPVAADTCPHCGGPIKQPSAPSPAAKAGGASGSRCPSCGSSVGTGDIVCTKCGTNLLTGKKVTTGSAAPAGRDMSRFGPALKVIAAVVVVAAVLAGAIAGILYMLHDPAGEAQRLARAGNLAQATEILQTHLERSPQDVEAQFLLGQIYWQGQQYARAAEAFESVARQGGPRDRDAALLALLATERLGDAGNRQRIAALLASLTQQRYTNDGDLLKILALLRGMEGEFRGQRQALDEAILVGGAVAPALPGLARALDGDIPGAERALLQAREQHPDDPAVPAALGFVNMLGDKPELAAEALERATDLDPDVGALVKLQLGLLHLRQGRPGRALPLLTAARNHAPEDDRIAFFHALCLQENKLLDEALVAYERLSGGTGAFAGPAALQMALIYVEQGALERAGSMARLAGEAGVNTARQATIQGRIHALLGELSQAEHAYRRAISLMGEYPAARLELGLLLINRGDIENGLLELDHYLELTKDDPDSYRANEIEVLVTQIRQTRQ